MGVKIIGLDRITKRLKDLPQGATKAVDASFKASANEIRNEAISRAPRDEVLLAKSIAVGKPDTGNVGATVVVNAYYGGYVEFGTGKKVNQALVSRYPEAAARVRSLPKKGDYFDFLNSILDWVRRKGIADTFDITKRNVSTRAGTRRSRGSKEFKNRLLKAASGIAFHILKNGIKSQPYFFPSLEKYYKTIVPNAGKALAKYLRGGR